MANYTAADVKRLRELTGSGMMDCKKALEESDGDLDKAVELLRIKGAKDVGKRAERATSQRPGRRRGRHAWSSSTARPTSSPRAPTSRRWPTRSCRSRSTRSRPTSRPEGRALDDGTVDEAVQALSARIGEKLELKRYVTSTARWRSTCTARHRPAARHRRAGRLRRRRRRRRPRRRDARRRRSGRVHHPRRGPEEVLDNERRIAEATAREEGKPEQVLPEIVEGRSTGTTRTSCCSSRPSVHGPRRPSRPCSTRPA